jgi:hypothetical protein
MVERRHDYTLDNQPFRGSRAGTALQNQGLDPCVRDFGGSCGWSGTNARSDGLACRPDRCHSRYMSANRLFFWNWYCSSPFDGRLIQEIGAANLFPHAGTAYRALTPRRQGPATA